MAARNSRSFGLDRLRLESLWDRLWSNYWFLPGLMTLAAGVMAVGIAEVDRRWIGSDSPLSGLLYGASAAGARAVLSTIAGSMITVAGVSFSVVLVALSQSASMFGPRLLPNFMRDRGNQVALGTFVATFVYCITLLMHVRGGAEEGAAFVPRLGVFTALLMALGSVAVLIYFLHHAATSIQAGYILRVAGRRLDEALSTVFPKPDETADSSPADPQLAAPRAVVPSGDSGYVEAVDWKALVSWAREAGVDVRLFVAPGDHVVAGDPLAEVGPTAQIDDETAEAVRREIVLSRERGGTRDVLYRVDQLVDMAVRALSPGVNDPLTAVEAVGRLGESLAGLLDRSAAPTVRRDEDGRVRLVEAPVTREQVVNRAFTLIRHYGAHDPLLPLALLASLRRLALRTTGPALRAALLEEARQVLKAARAGSLIEADRERVEEAFLEVEDAAS